MSDRAHILVAFSGAVQQYFVLARRTGATITIIRDYESRVRHFYVRSIQASLGSAHFGGTLIQVSPGGGTFRWDINSGEFWRWDIWVGH